MKLSISNIAWDNAIDEKMYKLLKESGYQGVEIAPTRLFYDNPYDKLNEAKEYADMLKSNYGLEISSMQSIWYGRTENIFNGDNDRKVLVDYTKKAIDFAKIIDCHNLVFGCPKNRNIPEKETGDDKYRHIAIDFFREIGEYAFKNDTSISLEANPPIYNTNFINTTKEALELISKVDSKGFKLNLDIGTMIYNNEKIDVLNDSIFYINHVHISEPYLKTIKSREIYNDIINYLKNNNYNKYVSIEMSKENGEQALIDSIAMVKSIF